MKESIKAILTLADGRVFSGWSVRRHRRSPR